ncbi:MAG: GGDEF domain-containing response regulator [Cellvibrionaceae bacterium]
MAVNPSTIPRESQKKVRILLADDSKLVRKTATKILDDKFDLILAEDGEEAWKILTEDNTIQVVFTDLGMPNLDGYGLIQRIRQSDQDSINQIPIIVITGAAEEESVKLKVLDIGATDFIGKPFKSSDIIARADAHASYRSDKTTLQKNVNIDLLTGTLNLKGLLEKMDSDVSFIKRHNQSLALLKFELHDFKTITQSIGKTNAEKIIKNTAKILSKAIRKEDTVGRCDYASFLTILPMAKTEGVVQLAKRLTDVVKSFKLKMNGEIIDLRLTVGIATVQKGSSVSVERLLKAADKALANARSIEPGQVQLLKIQQSSTKKSGKTLSIDKLLEEILQGQTATDPEHLLLAMKQLRPLVKQLSAEQRQQLIQ